MGPYGPYIQLDAAADGGEKARNVALPASAATSGVTLQVGSPSALGTVSRPCLGTRSHELRCGVWPGQRSGSSLH